MQLCYVHEDPTELKLFGMTGFLGKPFRQEELREALQMAMSPNPTGVA